MPEGTFKDVFLTSRSFSPKIARKSLPSGVWSELLFGVTLPTRISPLLTDVPTKTIPFLPK